MISKIVKAYPDCDPRVIGYAEDVLEGRIITGESIRMSCQRMIRDLERIGRPDFPWVFVPERASKPIRFMEKFVIPSGEYDRFDMMPWQCFGVGNLFGWRHKETGKRKYLKWLLIVGSGNGKSPLISGIGLYVIALEGLREPRVEVFANSKDQASIIVGDCASMINNNITLAAHFKVRTKGLFYDKGGYIKGYSNEPKNLDGIRPTVALVDEMHQMRNRRLLNHVQRNLQKAQAEQLEIDISTMGTVLDGVLVEEYKKGKRILAGIELDEVADRELVMIYEMDSEAEIKQDSALWIKANPSIGKLLRLEDLQRQWAGAQMVPERKADMLTKTFDIFTQVSDAAYVSWDLIKRNEDVVELNDLIGCEGYGGFDIGSSEDHVGAAVEVLLTDGRLVVFQHSWVPRMKAIADQERLDYLAMEREGWLTITDDHGGQYVDQQYVIDWFDEMRKTLKLQYIGYDAANATLLVRALENYRSGDKPAYLCEPVRQGALTLNAPMKHLREQFIDGNVVTNGNKLFLWYLNNVRLRADYKDGQNENWVPTRASAGDKIDGFAAVLDAHTVLMRHCGLLIPTEDDGDDGAKDYGARFIQLSI